MIGMRGAMPNHPKKHRKKAIHDMWHARMGTLLKSSRLMEVALLRMFIWILPRERHQCAKKLSSDAEETNDLYLSPSRTICSESSTATGKVFNPQSPNKAWPVFKSNFQACR